MRTNRVTSYGKGDASRSDPAKFREGLSWNMNGVKIFLKKRVDIWLSIMMNLIN